MIHQRTRNYWSYIVFLVGNYKRCVESLLQFFLRLRRKIDFFVSFLNFSIVLFLICCITWILFVLLGSLWFLCEVIVLFWLESWLRVAVLCAGFCFHYLFDCGGMGIWIQCVCRPWLVSWFAVALTNLSLWHAVCG